MRSTLKALLQVRGMTLVEMMVAIGVTSVIMILSISIFMSQNKSYVRSKNVKEVQESGQMMVEILKRDLMEAGWSVLPQMAFHFEDGGATGSDRIYVNDSSLIDLSVATNRANMIGGDCAGGQRIVSGAGTSNVTIGRLDVNDDEGDGDSSGDPDFLAGVFQFVISDATTNSIAKINTITSGPQLGLDRNLSGTHVAPAVYYCVDNGDAQCRPTGSTEQRVLRRSDRTTGGRQPMMENVVDMQVAYRDRNGNWYGAAGCAGTGVGAGLCAMDPFDPRQVAIIRLTLVTRGADSVEGRIYDPAYCRPAVENRTAAASGSAECGYVYRTYSAMIQPRNSGPLYQ
ncbi:MAG TPA: hypothetical protein PLM79_09505 [Syntrophobacteraceae bacterium]|nr:hypothetical protein [Syntrophobacteraceae bacterium]